MRETDREHRLIEHALSVMDLLRRNRLDLEQFVAGAIQPELPLEPQEEHLAREAIAFMDEMPGGFLIYRAGGDEEILYANRGLLRLLQCEDMEQFREMTGNSFRGLVHPDDLEHVEESIARQIADSHYDLDYVEYRVIRRDGTVRWIEDYGHFTQIPSAGGIFYVFLGDATEKRDRMDLEREQIYQENRRRLEVIEGLSINYESILYVDLDRDAIRPYRLSERTKVQFQEKLQSLSFSWYVADYAAVWVHPEDRELVARETSAERIRERLSREKTFYINYHPAPHCQRGRRGPGLPAGHGVPAGGRGGPAGDGAEADPLPGPGQRQPGGPGQEHLFVQHIPRHAHPPQRHLRLHGPGQAEPGESGSGGELPQPGGDRQPAAAGSH